MKPFPPVPTDPLRKLAWEGVRGSHWEWHQGQPWSCHEGLCEKARSLGEDLVTPEPDDICPCQDADPWEPAHFVMDCPRRT